MIESIKLEQINFSYPGQPLLLSNLSMSLLAGQSVRLRSLPSGGKSTVLKILAGLLLPTSGGYFLNGAPVQEMSFEEFLPYRLRIGYSFDSGGLLNNRSLQENLRLPLEYHRTFASSEIEARVQETLETFGLLEAAGQRPSSVSGSQRKVTCVARALIHDPDVLLLDDPTIGLGSQAKTALIDQIQKMQKGGRLRFLIVSTDDSEFVSRLQLKEQEIQPHQKVAV